MPAAMPAVPQGERYKAKFDFNGQDPDELSFKAGDILYVTRKGEDDWWEGTLNGRPGIFPCNYIEKA